MPEVRSFRAWRYDTAVAGSLDSLICPPYDVISPLAAQALLSGNVRNVVHLELGEGAANSAAPDNRYVRAAATLNRWIADGTLRHDEQPALYVYEQRFFSLGAEVKRRAFFAAVQLSPWSERAVLPHEVTLSAPKADRMALLAATRTNISPIYSLCDGGLEAVTRLLQVAEERPADMQAHDEFGEVHLLWVVTDPTLIDAVNADLATRPLYIADGHHRYETALGYAESQQLSEVDPEGAGFVLMAISPVDDPGLVVLPTHRLLHDIDEERFTQGVGQLGEYFELRTLPGTPSAREFLDELAKGVEHHDIGLYTPGEARILRPRQPLEALVPEMGEALRALDVSLLHELFFERLLHLTPEDLRRQSNLEYTRDAEEALRRVDEGSDQAAVLLNGTPPAAVVAVARADERMPQKSTYFYPKLATGLVLRRLQ